MTAQKIMAPDQSKDDVNVNGIGGSKKVENDPWVPLETQSNDIGTTSSMANTTLPVPQNPLYQIIDSERYIQSLEQKLAKLTKSRKRQNEPTSRDIINSLALFHEDQMRRYIDDTETSGHTASTSGTDPDGGDDGSVQSSFLHRRLYPERQPLNAEEIAELLRADVMAEAFEELRVDNSNQCSSGASGSAVSASNDIPSSATGRSHRSPASQLEKKSIDKADTDGCDDEENWANFDEMME